MALADADFAWRYPCGETAVAIECDRRTCYAYLGVDAPPFRGVAWLFNLVEGPEAFVSPDDGRAPSNPRPASIPFDLDDEVRPEAFSMVEVSIHRRVEIEIRYRDALIGAIWLGGRSGYSRFAAAASPVSAPFPDLEVRLHARALAETDPRTALALWRELAAFGSPEAPERLRDFARSPDPRLRGPARATLDDLGLSHPDLDGKASSYEP